jgi:UDP:flavonoid glycosyltransferase YjiC (YdhE family)
MLALAAAPVHVVATLPAGLPGDVVVPPNDTVREFLPHSLILPRAVCAVTHGGMGATLRAKVREAMTMTDGARRVAAGLAAPGGVARGADLFEQRVLGLDAG